MEWTPVERLCLHSGVLGPAPLTAVVRRRMITLADWLPPAAVGVTFTTAGFLKVFGWKKGIIGGGGKPASCRLLGRCPSWSKQLNIAFITLFFAIGLGNLGFLLAVLLKQ